MRSHRGMRPSYVILLEIVQELPEPFDYEMVVARWPEDQKHTEHAKRRAWNQAMRYKTIGCVGFIREFRNYEPQDSEGQRNYENFIRTNGITASNLYTK